MGCEVMYEITNSYDSTDQNFMVSVSLAISEGDDGVFFSCTLTDLDPEDPTNNNPSAVIEWFATVDGLRELAGKIESVLKLAGH